MEFSPDMHAPLHLIPSHCCELVPKASALAQVQSRFPQEFLVAKTKRQRLEEREKSYTSKSESWSGTKTTQKLQILEKYSLYMFFAYTNYFFLLLPTTLCLRILIFTFFR